MARLIKILEKNTSLKVKIEIVIKVEVKNYFIFKYNCINTFYQN